MDQRNVGFRVDLLFPDEYSDFIAEIYFDGKFICTISQEQGFDNLDMEFDEQTVKEKVNFPLRDFQRTVDHAIQRLFDLRKNDL